MLSESTISDIYIHNIRNIGNIDQFLTIADQYFTLDHAAGNQDMMQHLWYILPDI